MLHVMNANPGVERFWNKEKPLMKVMIPDYVDELDRRLASQRYLLK